MGGGDLNMKKSWHPVLLVNQERVWKAEKQVNEEKKKLAQLRKEQEEERQLAELQRLQEAATGRKRVEKLDWMYAAPGNEGGALGGQRLGEKDMEDYLLGKKRVDEVLAAGDRNVGNLHKEFIAVQNANSARDTAAKIREDPLLAIKRQELAAMEALKNRPDIRRKLKEMQKAPESKEERKARKKAEKEERKKERHERRNRHRDTRSPVSDYSDDRDDYKRRRRDSRSDERTDERRSRYRSRSSSPRRERDDRDRRRGRDESPRRRRDDGPRRDSSSRRRSDERDDSRVPPPRHYPSSNGHTGHSSRHEDIKPDIKPYIPHSSRPAAMDLADRPTSSRPSQHQPTSSAPNPQAQSLEQQRAARLAAMSASAHEMDNQRTKSLAQRAVEDQREKERDDKMRQKYGKEDVKGVFFAQKSEMGLSDMISRRAGQGLQRNI
ncbi:localization spliceosome protein [Dioszegia hungarica]|uniref:Localization spliceosome protein n=1 Tax=Dioszegia hungarica TaxID=4972 RepID=A0AA38H3A7_9TREE|nr:localization spliceosome protein [Dioszegia hungarica]KAI9631946.1 localization spliceosome protein [Dioszegia hungarica]